MNKSQSDHEESWSVWKKPTAIVANLAFFEQRPELSHRIWICLRRSHSYHAESEFVWMRRVYNINLSFAAMQTALSFTVKAVINEVKQSLRNAYTLQQQKRFFTSSDHSIYITNSCQCSITFGPSLERFSSERISSYPRIQVSSSMCLGRGARKQSWSNKTSNSAFCIHFSLEVN